MKVTLTKQAEAVVNIGNYQSIRLASGLTCDVEIPVGLSEQEAAKKLDEKRLEMAQGIAQDLRRSLLTSLEILGQRPTAAEEYLRAAGEKFTALTKNQS